MSIVSSSVLAQVIARESNVKGGVFTIKSVATGKEYTYKVSRNEYRGVWYTHVRVEQEYLKFRYLGTYRNGQIVHKGAVVNTPSAVAIAYVLQKAEGGAIAFLDERMEVRHAGKCISCGRTLTDAESIDKGLGPVCAG